MFCQSTVISGSQLWLYKTRTRPIYAVFDSVPNPFYTCCFVVHYAAHAFNHSIFPDLTPPIFQLGLVPRQRFQRVPSSKYSATIPPIAVPQADFSQLCSCNSSSNSSLSFNFNPNFNSNFDAHFLRL